MGQELSCKRYYVSGLVQGVGFRYFVERVARHRKIAGYVRNLRDGRVEVYAVGTPTILADLRSELQRGPSAANVLNVAEEDAECLVQYAQSFEIEYDA